MLDDKATMVYFLFLISVLLLGVIGPHIAPYDYDEPVYNEDGELLRTEPPSLEHPLGTNGHGQDVLSRLIFGARPTMITGLLGGGIIIGVGMTIGVTAGYAGGRIDSIFMRFTDLVYGVPLIPFALVLIALIGAGFIESIIIIGLVLWRGNARVLRSQVLQIKERPYILSARATGASPFRIIGKHILPNIASMAILFFALGIGYSILLQASLAFIGVTSPYVPSWGIIVRNAYTSGVAAQAWWWTIPPGLMISLTVMSTFMFGRSYEQLSGSSSEEAIVQAG